MLTSSSPHPPPIESLTSKLKLSEAHSRAAKFGRLQFVQNDSDDSDDSDEEEVDKRPGKGLAYRKRQQGSTIVVYTNNKPLSVEESEEEKGNEAAEEERKEVTPKRSLSSLKEDSPSPLLSTPPSPSTPSSQEQEVVASKSPESSVSPTETKKTIRPTFSLLQMIEEIPDESTENDSLFLESGSTTTQKGEGSRRESGEGSKSLKPTYSLLKMEESKSEGLKQKASFRIDSSSPLSPKASQASLGQEQAEKSPSRIHVTASLHHLLNEDEEEQQEEQYNQEEYEAIRQAWMPCLDPSTKFVYWYNSYTGESQWEIPASIQDESHSLLSLLASGSTGSDQASSFPEDACFSYGEYFTEEGGYVEDAAYALNQAEEEEEEEEVAVVVGHLDDLGV